MIAEKCGKTILSCHVDVCRPAYLILNKVRVGMILFPVKRLLFADLEFLVTRVRKIVILKLVHGIWTVTVVNVMNPEVCIHSKGRTSSCPEDHKPLSCCAFNRFDYMDILAAKIQITTRYHKSYRKPKLFAITK